MQGKEKIGKRQAKSDFLKSPGTQICVFARRKAKTQRHREEKKFLELKSIDSIFHFNKMKWRYACTI